MVDDSRLVTRGLPMSDRKVVVSPIFVISLMILSSFIPIFGVVNAGAGQGVITNFADGSNSVQITLNGSSTNSANSLALIRNSTINSAQFEISYSTTSPDLGDVVLDFGEDGQNEWAWDGIGYGSLGNQQLFSNDASTASASVNSSGNILGEILLPASGQIQTGEIFAEFTPTFDGGFVSTGGVDSLEIGDIDSDNLPEPIFLQRSHTWSNGTTSPAVGFFDWTSATGFTSVTWTSVCDGATSLTVADFNADSMADIAAFDTTNGTACTLITQSNGTWAANSNLSLGMGATAIDVGDMDGDGDYELISVHSDGSLKEFDYDVGNNTFTLGATTTVSANGTGMQATLASLAIGKFWGSGNDTVVVADSMDGHVTMWNISGGSWVVGSPGSSYDCAKGGLETVDWNGDGLLDVLGTTDMGFCTATFNGSGWAIDYTNQTQLSHFVVGDWNGDGSEEIVETITGSTDNNDSTPTGNLSVRPFGVNGTIASSSSTMFSHTAPVQILLADLDGDGLDEHIISAGEVSKGIWMAGWHNVSLDFDSDNIPEGYMIGFAGDGQNGLDELNWTDMGNISQSLSTTFSLIPSQPDIYSTSIATLRPMGFSIGEGSVTLSQMNFSYDVSFIIDQNPSSGNLTNLLNTMMVPATGNFNISIPINSTNAGSLTAESVMIEWVAGMANQVYRDAPIFQNQIIHWDAAENEHVVVMFWNDLATMESDFINYQLYRWENGSTPDFNTPYQTMIPGNMTFDNNSVSGKTWDYVVRTVYQNGVFSNFSGVLTVTVPDIQAADGEPPEAVASVMAADVVADEGGVIEVTWTPSVSTDVEWYALYVGTSEFTDVGGMTEIANISAYDNITSYLYNTTNDGTLFTFGIICGDVAGNVNWTVTTSQPTMSRNNSQRPTTISLNVVTDGITGGLAVSAGTPFSILGQLTSLGEPVPVADYSLIIDSPDDAMPSITIEGTTDASGNFNHSWNDWLDFESEHGLMVGDVSILATYQGGIWGTDSQSLAGDSAVELVNASTSATLIITPSSLQLDENGIGIITISLTADNAIEQLLLAGIIVDYQIGNQTNQAVGDTGTLSLTDGSVDLNIDYPVGGEVEVSLTMTPSWLSVTNPVASATLLPPPVVNEPGENETETPELIPLNWSCIEMPWAVLENASAVTNICTLENPNDALVYIDLTIDGPEGITVEALPNSFSIFANGDKEIQISLSAMLGITADNYSLSVEIEASSAGYNLSNFVEGVGFTVSAEGVVDGGDGGDGGNQNPPTDNTDPASSGFSMGMIGGIVAAIIAVLVVGFVVLRKLTSEDEFNEDDEEWMNEYDDDYDDDYDDEDEEEEPAPKRRRPKVVHSAAELQQAMSDFDDEPAPTPRSNSESSRRPKPLDISERRNQRNSDYEEYEESNEEYEEEDDYTQSEDYHMDDDGTEWWKDELGVWWYRYSDEEDWSEFIE